MRYLVRSTLYGGKVRRFYESSAGLDEQEVQDFCEMNLAYLVDEGLTVFTDEFGFGSKQEGIRVILSLKAVDSRKWIDIKDQVIPFLIRLKDQYELKTFDWVKSRGVSIGADIIFVTTMQYGKEDEGYSEYFNTDAVINESINRDWMKFTSIHRINEISFYIKNSKEV